MAAQPDYISLCGIQDLVLNAMVSVQTGFYLTGGTCLHRFITPRRYSEDLDFFCPDPNLFREDARAIISKLKSLHKPLTMVTDTRDFIRFKFADTLKVDMVNDRVYRHGQTEITSQGYRIDNILNILTNKITAIVSRDEPKDVFDLITIADTIEINWPNAIKIALEKALFETDFFIYRLKSFPLDMFDLLQLIDPVYLKTAKENFTTLVDSVISGT